MRNLKKVLSLTLALVMMLGMMTFAGAAETKKVTAADFKDMDKVVNKEAVTLLVDLGIINGIKAADGTYTFNPAGNIERGAYSKMIYAVMMNRDNADVYKGANTGLKDVKGHWAEGFIGYCVSTKIAVGNGNGTFTPNANISVVAGAKMLLTALGYDAKLSKYESDPLWSINIMADAQNAGLLEGVLQNADEILTRDNAAQMIYNALFAAQVKAVLDRDMGVAYLKEYVDKYKTDNTLGAHVFGLKEVIGNVIGTKEVPFEVAAGKKGQVVVATYNYDKDGNFTNFTNKTLDLTATAGLMGHQVKYFTDAKGKLLSTALIETGKTVVTTDTAAKAVATFVKDNSLETDNKTKYSTDYVDATTAAFSAPAAGETIFYINSDGTGAVEYIVKSTFTFGEVEDVNVTKGTIKITGAFGTKNIADVAGAADLAKGDYVLYSQTASAYTVEKAASFTGKVTALKTKGTEVTATIGDTKYVISNLKDVTIKAGNTALQAAAIKKYAPKDAVEGQYYTDKAGQLVLFVPSETTVAKSDYAYVEGFKVTAEAWSTGLTTEVKVVLADGTKAIRTLADNNTADNNKDTDSLKEKAEDIYTKAKGAAPDYSTLLNIYKYTMNDKGEMVIDAKAENNTNLGTQTAVSFVNGKPGLAKITGKYVDASTVAVFYKAAAGDNKEVLKAYTGIDNIPSFTSAAKVYYALKAAPDASFVSVMFVLAEADATYSDKQYAYLNDAADYSNSAKGFEVNFVVGGETKVLTLKDLKDTAGNAVASDKIYTFVEDADGVAKVTLVLDGATTGAKAGIKVGTVVGAYTSSVILNVGDEQTFAVDAYSVDDLTSFDKDDNLKPANGTLTAGAKVIAVIETINGKDTLVKAYIIPNPVVTSVSITKQGTTIKANETLTATVVGAFDGTVTYQWKKGGVDIKNATDSSYKTETVSGTEVFTCVVTVTSKLNPLVPAAATETSGATTVTIP